MDEKSYQLLEDAYIPLAIQQGCAEKVDYKYIRRGSCSIFLFNGSLGSWRHADVMPRRTKADWAHKIRWLLLEQYSDAEKVVLVVDNLNIRTVSSLYETFSPEVAFDLAQCLEIHFAPKHGSWLNIAEIELSALGVGCFGKRRVPDIDTLNVALSSWHTQRNQA